MSEFLQNDGFFIIVAVLMLICHVGRNHGRGADRVKRPGGAGHQH